MKPLKIIFAGTPEYAVPSLQALLDSQHQVCAVYTQPDRPAGRGRKLTASPIKQLALAHNIPILQPTSLRSVESQQELAQWQADVMIVIAYGMLLPSPVLTIPPLGCINVHPSLLPRWRGAAPIQRTLLAGDTLTGVTIMQMDAGFDTGPMLYKVTYPIASTDTTRSLHDKLASLGASALLTTLEALQAGKITPEVQDDNQACYAAKFDKAEAQLDWQESAEQLCRKIRAFNPWPVAYSLLNQQLLRIWQAQPLTEMTDSPPGTIIAVTKQGIDVATGNGILRLTQIQLPGGKPLPVATLLNAQRSLFIPGQLFT